MSHYRGAMVCSHIYLLIVVSDVVRVCVRACVCDQGFLHRKLKNNNNNKKQNKKNNTNRNKNTLPVHVIKCVVVFSSRYSKKFREYRKGAKLEK